MFVLGTANMQRLNELKRLKTDIFDEMRYFLTIRRKRKSISYKI